MKKINLSDLHKVVYSTNPDYKPEEEISDIQELSPAQQTLYIRLDRLKGNKMATVSGKLSEGVKMRSTIWPKH
jgi:hypothetical protein